MKSKHYIILGATDAISAFQSCKIGADYIWASSFVISSMFGLKDDGMVNIKKMLSLLNSLIKGSACPVILDFDVGGKNITQYRSQLRLLKNLSLGGICIEDEKWPKVNALLNCVSRILISPKEMALKISIAKKLHPSILLIARTHSLITKEPFSLLQDRVNNYINAGADVICIHYIGNNWNFYQKIINGITTSKPLMVILSKVNQLPKVLLGNSNIRFVLFPNQIYRMMLYPLWKLKNSKKTKNNHIFSGNEKFIETKEIFKISNKIFNKNK